MEDTNQLILHKKAVHSPLQVFHVLSRHNASLLVSGSSNLLVVRLVVDCASLQVLLADVEIDLRQMWRALHDGGNNIIAPLDDVKPVILLRVLVGEIHCGELQCIHGYVKHSQRLRLSSRHHPCPLFGGRCNLEVRSCAPAVGEVAQCHGNVHVLHVVRSLLHTLHQVELRENRLPVLEYLLLDSA